MFSGLSQNFWVNLIGFNLAWYLCVFMGNEALLYVSFLLFLHLLFHKQPFIEILIVFIVGILGFCVDLFLTLIDFFEFEGGLIVPPLWLMALWFCFCATLRQSLSFFNDRTVLAAFFGALGGSSSYIAGGFVGVVSFSLPLVVSAFVISFIWMILFPSLLWLSQQIEVRVCSNR